MGPLYAVLCYMLYKKQKAASTISKHQKIVCPSLYSINLYFRCYSNLLLSASKCSSLRLFMSRILGSSSPHSSRNRNTSSWFVCMVFPYKMGLIYLVLGDTPFVYLMLNATLRKQIVGFFKKIGRKTAKIGEMKAIFATKGASRYEANTSNNPSHMDHRNSMYISVGD